MTVLFPDGFTAEFNAVQFMEGTVQEFTELVLLGLSEPSNVFALLDTTIEQFETSLAAAENLQGPFGTSGFANCFNILRIVGTGVLYLRRQIGNAWFQSSSTKLFMKSWMQLSAPARLMQLIRKRRKPSHSEMRTYIWWFTCLIESFDGIPHHLLPDWKPLLRDFFNANFPTSAEIYHSLHMVSNSPIMPTRGLLSFGLRMDCFALAFKGESNSKISNIRDTLLKYGYLNCSKQRFTGQCARWHTIPVSMCAEDERYIDIVGDSGYFSEWLYDYFRCFRLVIQKESGQLPVVPLGYFSQVLAVLLSDNKKHHSKPWFKDLQRIVRECPSWLLILMLNYSGEYLMQVSSVQMVPNEIGAWLFFYKYGAMVDTVTLGAFLARAIYQKIDKASCEGYGRLLNESFWKDIVVLPVHNAALFTGLRKFNQISGARMTLAQFKQGLKHWGIPNVHLLAPLVTFSNEVNISFFCAWCDVLLEEGGYFQCPSCQLTMYCSKKCCQVGSERHKKLCPLIREIADSNHGKSEAVEKLSSKYVTLEDLAIDVTLFVKTGHHRKPDVTGYEAEPHIEANGASQFTFPARCGFFDQAKSSEGAVKPESKSQAKSVSKTIVKPDDSQAKATATPVEPLEQAKSPGASNGTATPATSTPIKKHEEERNVTGLFECASCGKNEATMLCGRCFGVHYCNRDCQKAHWKQHKATCRS